MAERQEFDAENMKDRAQIRMQDLIQTFKEIDVFDVILELDEILINYPELAPVIKSEIEVSIQNTNIKIDITDKDTNDMTEGDKKRISEEKHGLYSRSRALLKVNRYFQKKLWGVNNKDQ